MRSGSEPSHRIDRRGMLDVPARNMSSRLKLGCSHRAHSIENHRRTELMGSRAEEPGRPTACSMQSANEASPPESSRHAFTGRIQKIREPGHP